MPHITVEYSSNLKGPADKRAFLLILQKTLIAISPTYLMSDFKSRMIAYDDYQVADGNDGFVHMQLAIMPREDAVRKESTTRLLAAIEQAFGASDPDIKCHCSAEIRDLDKPTYAKGAH